MNSSVEKSKVLGAIKGLFGKHKNKNSQYSDENSTFMPKKKNPKKKWIIIAICIVVIVGLLFGLKAIRSAKSSAKSTVTYTTATVKKMDISNTLSSSGTLAAAQSYEVTSLVSGNILTADFAKGDTVKKGQTLYQIDTTDAKTSIESAKLNVQKAQLSYDNTRETLDNLNVKAPVSGTITTLNVSVGDTVNSGANIGTVKDSATMSLSIPFNSADVASFYIGEAADVTLDSTFETLSGKVTKISGAEQVLTGNELVKYVTIDVSNPGGITDSTSATAKIGDIACSKSATFAYKSSSQITAKASGTVASIVCDEGDNVSKGATVIKLESDDIEQTITNAQISLEDAQNSLANKEKSLEDYTITSPIDGTVIVKSYKAGDKITSGSSSTTLCTIYDLSYLTMEMDIDELDISEVSVGQAVTITADAVSGKTFSGTVTNISMKGTTTSGVTAYPVTVQINDTTGLLPGMNVDAEIAVKTATNVLGIPVDAVTRGDKVLVQKSTTSTTSATTSPTTSPTTSETTSKSASKSTSKSASTTSGTTLEVGSSGIPDGFEYVTVTLGINNDNYIEVDSGLTEGETIAVVTVDTSSSSSSSTKTSSNLLGGGSGGSGGGGGGPEGGGGGPMGG